MVRLIDADALKSVFTEKSTEAVCGAELCKAIISRIDDAPTVEAVPVIRCKDCKKFVVEEDQAYCLDMYGQCDENGFCAWAERKEE